MDKKNWWISALTLLFGLAGGFLIANSINRGELNTLRAENQNLKQAKTAASPQQQDDLTDEEIRQKINDADQNPQNFAFQKSLGIGLYRYATMKENVDLLADVEKILRRAHDLNTKDYDVTINLGHALFDIGYAKKNNDKFIEARKIYQNALEQRKDDDEIRIDYGLTFLFTDPPEPEKTLAELNEVLQNNPQQERALQFKAQALLQEKKSVDAKDVIARLKTVSPDNPAIPELEQKANQIQ